MIKREYWDLKLLKAHKQRFEKQVAKVDTMPEDYQKAYEKISEYVLSMYGGFDGFDAMEALYQLIDSFEEVIAEGLNAQDFVSAEPSTFAKELMEAANIPNWADKMEQKRKKALNKKVLKKLQGGK